MADRGHGRRTVLGTTRRSRSTPTDTTWKPFWEAWVSAARDVAPRQRRSSGRAGGGSSAGSEAPPFEMPPRP